MPTTRVMILHLEHPARALDHLTADIGGDLSVGMSAGGAFTDSFRATIALTDGMGTYKTQAELETAVIEAAKEFAYEAYGIPTDGYAAVYIT